MSPTLDRLAAAGVEVDIGRPGDDFLGLLSVIGSLLLTGVVADVLVVQFDLRGRLSWPAAAKSVPDRFTDVAGQDEPKSELAEIVSFLKNPGGFAKVGARPPHGVLMVGPPGTGKTLLARALAGEAGVTFMAVAGSEFSAAFVGVSKTRVARLFKEARRKAPCILFIDEIDSLGKKRGAGSSAADREYDTTLNQLLVEMDGFEASAGVIVVGATNRVDVLDPALLRPGRFDRQIHVGLPDIARARGDPAPCMSPGRRWRPMSCCARWRAARRASPARISPTSSTRPRCSPPAAAPRGSAPADFESARTKMLMGLERRSLVLDDGERLLVAVHEAGHALCASLLPAADPCTPPPSCRMAARWAW